jgi:hypothetical protein
MPAGSGAHADGRPVQLQHGSIAHAVLQPSPFAVLPSSQTSPGSNVPLPQRSHASPNPSLSVSSWFGFATAGQLSTSSSTPSPSVSRDDPSRQHSTPPVAAFVCTSVNVSQTPLSSAGPAASHDQPWGAIALQNAFENAFSGVQLDAGTAP